MLHPLCLEPAASSPCPQGRSPALQLFCGRPDAISPALALLLPVTSHPAEEAKPAVHGTDPRIRGQLFSSTF